MPENTFEELTGIEITDTPEARPFDLVHGQGSDTRRAASDAAIKLDRETGVVETVTRAFEGNIAPMLYDAVQRKYDNAPDDKFDKDGWLKDNAESLPGVNLEEFSSVRSQAEAEELRDDMIRAEENQRVLSAKGAGGLAAQLLVGLADIDAPLMFVSGGVGTVAKGGARLAQGALKGAATGTALGAAAVAVDPLADAKQVVASGLFGAVLGTAGGGSFNRAARDTRMNYSAAVDDLGDAVEDVSVAPVFHVPVSQTAEEVAEEVVEVAAKTVAGGEKRAPVAVKLDPALQPLAGPSVGAGSRNSALNMDEMNDSHRTIFANAQAALNREGISAKLDDPESFADTPAGRTAKRFSDALATNKYLEPLRTDFDRMASGGAIEQWLAYGLFESAEGRVRNNTSGAMLRHHYEQRLASQSMEQMEIGYTGWAKSRKVGVLDKHFSAAKRNEFDREVIAELEARFHEGKPVSQDPHIKLAADGIDANSKLAVEVGRGRDGELPVTGFETMQAKSGFFGHRWNGNGIRRVLKTGRKKSEIADALATAIAKTNPDMEPKHRLVVAKAIINRALSKEDGVDSNMLATMDADGQDFLRQMLTDNSVGKETIDNLMDSIRGKAEERGTLGTTKKRVQVDLRTEVNGIKLMDLVDTNLTRVQSRYNRDVAGAAALARKGIQNRGQRTAMIDAAMAERRARGMTSAPGDREFLEDMFTHFDSGPIGGGINPWVSRAKRLTNLALLNQMGLTQAGEAGAQIAAVGIETWWRHAKPVMADLRRQGPDGPIANELKPLMGNLGNEHMLFRDDLMLDELSTQSGATTELHRFTETLDKGLGKGQRLQGYVSGFFAVKSFQQRVAVTSMADKAMQRLRDGVDSAQLADIGVPQKLKKYIDDKTVTFTDEGYLDKLNLEDWDPADAEQMVLALHRHTHQTVQRAMAGEESMWMHKSVGSLMIHLKSFPLVAMRKQAVRNAAIGNPAFYGTLLMGLATAGLAYEVKQLVNGNTDRLTPEDALKGAMGMSNMTGWIPMLADPAAAVLGLDDWRFSAHGRHSIEQGIIAVPPAIPTLNRMGHLPGAFNPVGTMSQNERLRAIQTTPIVGNLYGFSGILNAMKD